MRIHAAIALCCSLAAACSPRPAAPPVAGPQPARDSVMVASPAPAAPDLVAMRALRVHGGAHYDSVTVGEAGLMRAENAAQLAAARRLVESGAYVSDPYRVIRLVPSTRVDAVASLGREVVVGTPLTVELLLRPAGPAPAPVLRFEHVSEGGDGRRMPSAIAFELLPGAAGGYDRARLLLGDGDAWSEQEAVELPAGDWAQYAHRIGIVLARDLASIAVDGNAVIEQQVRLHGGEAVPRLRAVAGAAGASVTILQLTGVVEDEFIGGPADEHDDDDDDEEWQEEIEDSDDGDRD